MKKRLYSIFIFWYPFHAFRQSLLTERHFNDGLKRMVIEPAMHHYNKATKDKATLKPGLLSGENILCHGRRMSNYSSHFLRHGDKASKPNMTIYGYDWPTYRRNLTTLNALTLMISWINFIFLIKVLLVSQGMT